MKREWPLTGRAEELELVTEAVATAGSTYGYIIAGAAGVGKTRLAREVLAVATSRGMTTRWVAATESARSVPLGAFHDIVGKFGPDPGMRVREAMSALTPHGDSVICVDDAHLLDDLSALVVHQLVLTKTVRVVLTIRSGMPAPDAVTAVWKDRLVERLDLQTLSVDETCTLIEAVLGGQLDSRTARGLWTLSCGNVLYVRQLVDEEVSARRLENVAGVWIWDGQPVISPRLNDLVDARMGRVTPRVLDVVDVLALCEPLDADVLIQVTSPGAVEEAETQGLIDLTAKAKHIRHVTLAHPLFGEIRRARCGALRKARICGHIATELATRPCVDMRDAVQRAILVLDSDIDPEATQLLHAARCAMQLLDLELAERLVRASVCAGAGVKAQTQWAITLTTLGRGSEAQQVLAELEGIGLPDADIATTSAVRAAIVLWMLGDPGFAQRILAAAAGNAKRSGAMGPHTAVRASLSAATGNPSSAIQAAKAALSKPLDDFHSAIATFALVISLGELGRIREMRAAADVILEIAQRSPEAAQLKFALGQFQSAALRTSGNLDDMLRCGERLWQHTVDTPGNLSALAAMLRGHTDLAFGRLTGAVRWLREARAEYAIERLHARAWRALNLAWLAQAYGKNGDGEAASAVVTELANVRPADFPYVDMDCALAEAWASAAEGALHDAISTAQCAADTARARGQLANEVLCLQTATQFGDISTAQRLAKLVNEVDGPRAVAASAHAAALKTADGPALLRAAHQYTSFGDRVAAADASAQAALRFAASGHRGTALSAHAATVRLAAECQCLHTPALRELEEPIIFTGRQREIVRLATQGLTNRDIAQRLVLSVRTVEGHLYRASQRAGVTNREDLVAILGGG
ncbi:MAG: LuxR family transcriptional regulator [Rhodococcus sp. (in: high G+C Gram-positive bacteria)]|nr:MAG: LuxR family transcriptional regulator [Rhodococcus sp. (in: high G+C Gram-positive bacteria)]